MRQLVITEKSVPEHIKTWLGPESRREIALLAAKRVTSNVRKCIELVQSAGLRLVDMQQELPLQT